MAAVGELSVWAMTENPSGIFSILSPWLIQTTVVFSGESPVPPTYFRRSLSSSSASSALPYSRLVAFATTPPKKMGQKLHAVAYSQYRDAKLQVVSAD